MNPQHPFRPAGILLLLALLTALPGAAQHAASSDPLYQNLRPLASALNADGTLDARAHTGALDAKGYRMTTTATGAPRFVPEAAAGSADGYWDDRFGMPGISFADVNALLARDGSLYAAGWITDAGGLSVTNIARWDGRRWHPLGEGVEGTVYALAWYDGQLYVAGRIDKAGGVLANGIARWDGTAWSGVGDGMIGEFGEPIVYALAVYKGALYAGGQFKEAGGVAVRGLARWDGTAWAGVGDVMNGPYGSAGEVFALAADETALYAGGNFDSIGGVEAASVAAWNGTAWAALGGGALEDDLVPHVKALALQGNQLYVGGGFDRAAGKTVRNIAVWNRATATWSGLGQGMRGQFGDGEVRALLPLGGELYAAGDFAFAGGIAAKHVARWNGTAWSALTQEGDKGVDFAASALAPGPNGSVFVAGSFEHAGLLDVNRIARWEGGAFHTLGEGVHGGQTTSGTLYGVATSADGKVYVAGQFRYAGSAVAENVAMWDGQQWHALGSGADGIVYCIATRGNDVFIGGRFTSVGGVAARYIARWDGQQWHALGSGTNGYVWDIATDAQWVYAVGDFTAAGGVAAEDMARWDGNTWSKLGQGIQFNPNGTVYSILLDGDHVWVGGDFLSVKVGGGYATVNSLLTWKQSTDEWFTVGGGVTRKATNDVWGLVYSLAKLNGEIYVGGRFDKAGGVGANSIARWDGTNWAALGSGVGGENLQDVNALVPYGTDLYVGGRFLTAGSVSSRAVARWNATTQTWAGLEGGLSGSDFALTHALARHEQRLYAGGIFMTAGGAPASGFAQWHIQGTPPPAGATVRVDPGRVEFTELIAGREATQIVTVTNVGAAATMTGEVGALPAPFSVVSGGGAFTLAPGQSRSVTVRFAPTAAGDFSATLSITHNGTNTGSPVAVAVTGKGANPNQTVALRAFDPQGTQLFVAANGDHQTYGFVFGTNGYGDRSKAMGFSLPTGTTRGALSQVRAWFIYKKAGLGERTYTLHIYDGSMISGPSGQPLYSKTYRLADIAADDLFSTASGPTTYTFDQPVEVGPSFFVVFDFGTYTAQEAVMVSLSNTDEMSRRVPEVWEQWADGRWANVSDAWTGNQSAPGTGRRGWYPWVEATVTTGTGTPNSPAEEVAETTLSQNTPNPFGTQTAVAFTLARAEHATLVVHDVLGREVARVVDAVLPAGHHTVPLSADALSSGTYFYTLRAGGYVQTRQMTVVR